MQASGVKNMECTVINHFGCICIGDTPIQLFHGFQHRQRADGKNT